MTIERIVELELFIEREKKGNEALTNDAGCVARAKIDRDILACLKELKAHREAWEKVSKELKAWQNDPEIEAIAQDAYGIVLDMTMKYRPKEGDAE